MSDDAGRLNAAQRPTAAGMLCPVCRVDLVMSERQGVEIDYCPRCRGVWLDRGELDKILERNAAELGADRAPSAPPVSPPTPEYRREQEYRREHYRHDDDDDHKRYGHGKPYRRKSFLEELFD